jgi:hypothetical protein
VTDLHTAMMNRRTGFLEPLRARLRRSKDDNDAEFKNEYLANKVFRDLPGPHKAGVQERNFRAIHDRRAAAVGAAMVLTMRTLRQLEPMARAERVTAMRAPTALLALLDLTGGDERFIDDHTQWQAVTAHEMVMLRLQRESENWQPSTARRVYDRATSELQDLSTVRTAASTIMFIEQRHGEGWAGPVPSSQDEESEAITLRRTIHLAQVARVPPELDVIEADLQATREMIETTTLLDQVNGRDPERDESRERDAERSSVHQRTFLVGAPRRRRSVNASVREAEDRRPVKRAQRRQRSIRISPCATTPPVSPPSACVNAGMFRIIRARLAGPGRAETE